jgi:uncharacterized membrane protein (UPF0127 family)
MAQQAGTQGHAISRSRLAVRQRSLLSAIASRRRPLYLDGGLPAQGDLWMCHRVQWAVVLVCALALAVLGSPGALSAGELEPLEIVSKSGVHTFGVEMAATPEEQAKGLMFRRELPEGQGMLFDFHREQPAAFWMKNTYIPLDMIFIRGDGRILRIAEHTVPLSEELVRSGGPVRAVLEVVAGTAQKLGIAPGDRVAHPIFNGR